MLPPGASGPDDAMLSRFVRDRLPHAGLKDPHQLIEPKIEALLANYGNAGMQLVRAQWGRGDTHAAYLTLELLQRELTGAHLGAAGDAQRKALEMQMEGLRERARTLGISP